MSKLFKAFTLAEILVTLAIIGIVATLTLPNVVAKYQKRIDTLMAATRIEDLFVFNSLNFEALDNGYFSIRIDYHYRLEFKIRQEGTEPIVTICTVTDITNHYQ